MFVSLTNPKALLASLILYPLFLTSQHSYSTQAATLSLFAMLISFLVYCLYSASAMAFKNKLKSSSWANKVAGGLYLSSAGALASK